MPCVAKSVNPFLVDMIIIHYNEHTQQAHDLSLQLPINPVLQLLQMSIQHNLLLHPIRIQIHHSLSVELWVCLMDDTVVVRTYDHLIVGIVVQAFDIVINVMRFRDVSAEFLTDQLPAEMTTIPVEKFEVLSNLSVQLPDSCHPLIDNEACFGIDKIIVKVRFNTVLLLVFDQLSEFLQIACNDRFQYIAVIVLCRINREVLL